MKREKDVCNLTAREMRERINLVKELLYNSSTPVVTFKSKYGYVFLDRQLNKKLFTLLDGVQFWDFHCSNSKKQICSLHQIILYIKKGWKLFLRGYVCDRNETEIHHLDHNPSNNCSSNLVYVTSQENKLLSDFCRMTYHGYIKSASINPFGKRRHTSAFIKIIQRTIKATFSRLGLNAPVESTFAWLLSLPQKLGKEIIYTWQHLPTTTKQFINATFN